jgi:hypothetical protein
MAAGDPHQAGEAMRAAIEFAGFETFADALFTQMFLEPSAPHAVDIIERAKRLPAEVGRRCSRRWRGGMPASSLGRCGGAMPAACDPEHVDEPRTQAHPDARRPDERLARLLREQVRGVRIEILPGPGSFSADRGAGSGEPLLETLTAQK